MGRLRDQGRGEKMLADTTPTRWLAPELSLPSVLRRKIYIHEEAGRIYARYRGVPSKRGKDDRCGERLRQAGQLPSRVSSGDHGFRGNR